MVCLKFLRTVMVWILCFSDLHYVICGFEGCFMTEIVVFYDFVHFIGKMDFVAEPHPVNLTLLIAYFYSYFILKCA
ncbi:hypothetical protein Hanom_Chr16g01453681 [Helianthus anomalus]